jgi:amino acid transporter
LCAARLSVDAEAKVSIDTTNIERTETPIPLAIAAELPESVAYRVKRRLLGRPLTSDQMEHTKLSKTLALGVLSSDCISSSAYGSEEMLIYLIPAFGLAGFNLLLPMTAVVLTVLLVVTLCYRQVVMLYTKAGGSYVVARENFGPRIAQIGAVALMIDYIVTVAVQSAAGTAAITSAIPATSRFALEITVGVVLLLFIGNLRGIREAGRTFAFPTYFFVVAILLVIIIGIYKELTGGLPHLATNVAGMVHVGHNQAILSFGAIYLLLKAFANGGSSLTGLEAISNGVGVFNPPVGRNARRTLVTMSILLGTLVAGVSWLAHVTHAMPYSSGSPTVISQVARAVVGHGAVGNLAFFAVQVATMLILYTGANTPFNGFPFLASFVAEDSFLPRWLSKRGHRLAFSNGIVVLTVTSLALLIITKANVNNLIAFYAIGVFTGFTLAGFGMAKHFLRERVPGWRGNVWINVTAGVMSLLVVLIFAITKFTEGAWLVVVVFPIGVWLLIRLNRTYRREAEALATTPTTPIEPNFGRHVVLVLVDHVDLATIRAVIYARSLKPYEVRAVHFVVDEERGRRLAEEWQAQPGLNIRLDLVECPDRRLPHATLDLAHRLIIDQTDAMITFLLPRRTTSALAGRILHDRTADSIAEAISSIPRAVATIVPFDTTKPLAPSLVAPGRAAPARPRADVTEQAPVRNVAPATTPLPMALLRAERPNAPQGPGPIPRASLEPAMPEVAIRDLMYRARNRTVGRIAQVSVAPIGSNPALAVELFDDTGGITLLFYGRRRIPGIRPGVRLRVTGVVSSHHGHLAIANPLYEIVVD